ncbi:MAG: adenosine deaminase [Bdellovibrionia bacterium]
MQAELHRHLDVSLRTDTLLKLAQERGLEAQSTSLEAFREKLILRKPLKDLSEVLAQFTLFQKVLDRPDVLERVAFEVLEDCWLEGTFKAELRYSPNFVGQYSGLSPEDSLAAFHSGINQGLYQFPGMSAGLICIASRDYGPDNVDQTVEFFLKNRQYFIGLDLAGNEDQYPCRLFESSFKKVRQSGANITIHAGEAAGPENIWEAIELLGAQRIGHGVTCVRDPKLMEYLREKKICLEMCPTSNWLTQAVPSLKQHPLPQILRAGVPVSINTDDPGMFGVSLPQEFENCKTEMGLSSQEIDLCMKHAWNHSFISEVADPVDPQ